MNIFSFGNMLHLKVWPQKLHFNCVFNLMFKPRGKQLIRFLLLRCIWWLPLRCPSPTGQLMGMNEITEKLTLDAQCRNEHSIVQRVTTAVNVSRVPCGSDKECRWVWLVAGSERARASWMGRFSCCPHSVGKIAFKLPNYLWIKLA